MTLRKHALALISHQQESRNLFFINVLESLRKVNESLSRVVNMSQSPNSGEASSASAISSTALPPSSDPSTSNIFVVHQRLFDNAAVWTNSRVNQILQLSA